MPIPGVNCRSHSFQQHVKTGFCVRVFDKQNLRRVWGRGKQKEIGANGKGSKGAIRSWI